MNSNPHLVDNIKTATSIDYISCIESGALIICFNYADAHGKGIKKEYYTNLYDGYGTVIFAKCKRHSSIVISGDSP